MRRNRDGCCSPRYHTASLRSGCVARTPHAQHRARLPRTQGRKSHGDSYPFTPYFAGLFFHRSMPRSVAHVLLIPPSRQVQSRMNVSQHFHSNYPKLHALAEQLFRRQSTSSTLQPTALIHEVYLRFAELEAASIHGREHFMALAATAMRQVLIDKARRKKADKRGGHLSPVTFHDELVSPGGFACDLVALHDLISRLALLNERQARIVEMRIFGDMTIAEIAHVLDVSVATVEKDWRQARVWLRLQLDGRIAA